MDFYIRAASIISPQQTFGYSESTQILEYSGNRLTCVEPDYKEYIDVKLIRRMSRIIKMGVTAAIQCLKAASLNHPDAIITGTAYGCLENTTSFLKQVVENTEDLLSPSAFINSTHNTIGAQISLLLKCNNYNNTFTNGGFSFESALLDSMMMLKEKEDALVLVGGVDELTDASFAILNRFGIYRRKETSNKLLFNYDSKGTIAGEGAAYFILSNFETPDNIARLVAITTFYKPKDQDTILHNISDFLEKEKIKITDIDLVITGRNGNISTDRIYDSVNEHIFKNNVTINYKQLSGEYPTSVIFAVWMAILTLKNGKIPFHENIQISKNARYVLIYNHYNTTHHSLLLFSAC